MKRYLIFTDLDGTLLDHENYSYGNNKKLISRIVSNQNEIIFNTSKTFSECKYLLKELNLISSNEWWDLISNEIIIDIKSIVTLKAYQTMWITNY